ncbi:N-acyl-D-amino acid deacylase [Halobacteriales archaeon QS_5_70_15]|nr:MAG: N-acyl-D-amino acid deacylase [Halobacteriales archaeon QS_5_70_15]
MADLLLDGARVVDGTGAPWFEGSVVVDVDGGRIEAVHRGEGGLPEAATTVDLGGDVVCPGFVDTHSHSDLELFRDPALSPKTRQGVTTEVLGQDGFSVAPVSGDRVDEWRRQLGPLAGEIDREWSWRSVSEYLDAVEARGVGPNVATLVGHGTVRHEVLGMADRAPDQPELARMERLVDRALEAGAIGVSTGLVYTPQTYAGTGEVERLAGRLAPYGRPFVAHIRSERRRIWSAIDEFVDVGAEQGIPLHLSHFKMGGPPQHGRADRGIALLEAARDRGVDITAEAYPYTASSTTLTYVLPPWVYADGPDGALERLADEEARRRIRRDVHEYRIEDWENPGEYSGWGNVVVTQAEQHREFEGESIERIADEWDTDPVLAACDLLLENDLQVSVVNHFLAERDVREILGCERVNVASDGLFGGKPHPRVYGTFPRVLGHYARDENLLSMEEAVRRMTALPARAMGLQRKGVLRPGMDADLVVFDPDVVSSPATFDSPRQYPRGISHVLVDGEFVVRDGEGTDARPGTAIRK